MESLKDWLIRNEGIKQTPYTDTVGKLTIGVGRNLTDRGLTLEEVYYLLDNDIDTARTNLEHYSWYVIQPFGVRDALCNMCFNMGLTRLLKFEKMIEALKAKKYQKAAAEALDSVWAKQVGKRAQEVAAVIREGK
jgi:lysozyme